MRLLSLSLWSLLLAGPALHLAGAESVLKIVSPAKTLALTADEFTALPHTTLKLPATDDQPARDFSGVTLRELLRRVDAPLGDKMRGAGLITGVIVRCKDNYAVLFALAEFDESFSNRTILLADKESGEILPPSAAPFRIVAPGDKRGARSCKQVVSIEVVSLAKP